MPSLVDCGSLSINFATSWDNLMWTGTVKHKKTSSVWMYPERFLLVRLYYSIVPSSEMSGSICLCVCLCVCICDAPLARLFKIKIWKLYHMIEKLSKAKDYAKLISSDTMRHNYATFHEFTTFDISILNFNLKMDGLRMTLL